MEPVYGNYLGFVVNNQDPEERKRVQVFVPHLSVTLFDKWNKQSEGTSGEDLNKKIRSPEDIAPILEKLKQILPWAEAAAPLFGGSTGITSNSSTGRQRVNNNGTTLAQMGGTPEESGAVSGGAQGGQGGGSSNLTANRLLIFSGSNDSNVAAYKLNLEASINAALGLGKPVVVVQPALGGDGGSGIANAAQEIADKFKDQGVSFISNTSYTTSDGVHPDSNGYKQIGLGAGSVAFGDSVAVGYNAANGNPNNDLFSTIDGVKVGERGIGSAAILDLLLNGLPLEGALPEVDTEVSPEEEKALEEMPTPQTTGADGEAASVSSPVSDIKQGQWNNAIATTFGYIPNSSGGLVADPEDNQSGAYIGSYSSDVKGASLSLAALQAWGIPENQGGNYDVIVSNGTNTIRVPIIDKGPADWVEARQGHTIDLTGAASLALGTTGKDNIVYQVVPRDSENPDLGSVPAPSDTAAAEQPQDNFVEPNRDARNANAAGTPNLNAASGSPNGTLTVPNPGAKVWVFFYGGDVQKPVYFAAAIEPTT